MNGRPTVVEASVVIPCHNAAATLGEQLAALERQTFAGTWEIVAVDNGSTDDTGALLADWQMRLPRLRVISLDEPGSPSRGRNVGLRECVGDRVLFCDADDVVADDWVGSLVRALDEDDLVGGPVSLQALNPGWSLDGQDPREGSLPISCDHLPFAHTGNLGVWRAHAVELGGFDEAMATSEDQDFSWRAAQAGMSVGFASDALVHVRLRTTWGALWRQRVGWGMGSVDLYVRHRDLGMPPPRRIALVLRELATITAALPGALVSRRTRVHCISSVAFLAGRLRGSLKHRTLYL